MEIGSITGVVCFGCTSDAIVLLSISYCICTYCAKSIERRHNRPFYTGRVSLEDTKLFTYNLCYISLNPPICMKP